MRTLNLGCGGGKPLPPHLPAQDSLVGLDVAWPALRIARSRDPGRQLVCGRGEALPFADASFDRVVSSVALPYMNIPQVLEEICRVLKPGGVLWFSVHPLSFTLKELRLALRGGSPKAILYRLYVIANGCWFHVSGRTVGLWRRKIESFQTRRGLRLALTRAGFQASVIHEEAGKRSIECWRNPPTQL